MKVDDKHEKNGDTFYCPPNAPGIIKDLGDTSETQEMPAVEVVFNFVDFFDLAFSRNTNR